MTFSDLVLGRMVLKYFMTWCHLLQRGQLHLSTKVSSRSRSQGQNCGSAWNNLTIGRWSDSQLVQQPLLKLIVVPIDSTWMRHSLTTGSRARASHASRARAGRSRQRQSKWADSTRRCTRTALVTPPFSVWHDPGSSAFSARPCVNYITKLPKTEHEAAEWQAAMEALILVATLGGPTTFARIGIMGRPEAEGAHRMKLTRRFAALTPEKRPQDPRMDGTGLRFETQEHGGEYPDTMPQAVKLIDAEGRSCIYVPISQDGRVVDSQGFALELDDEWSLGGTPAFPQIGLEPLPTGPRYRTGFALGRGSHAHKSHVAQCRRPDCCPRDCERLHSMRHYHRNRPTRIA